MTDNQQEQYLHYTKVAWRIYAAAVILLAVILVLFVASDNEEKIFFGLMTIAGAYVFRPTDRFFERKILKYTGMAKPAETETEKEEKE